jgi:phytoene dehydrogenase-like protein
VASIVIIGAGHNGLIAAWALAREGHRPVVLERRSVVGGCAITGDLAPGFRAPVLSHVAWPLIPGLAEELQLERYGVRRVGPVARRCALRLDGPALVIDDDRLLQSVGDVVPGDRDRFLEFTDTVRRLGALLSPILTSAPPSIDDPGLTELITLLASGRRFRSLGRRDAYRLLQWLPMPIADLVTEWFDDELVRAVVAARGIFGRWAGPRSAGTMLALLMQTALSGRVVAAGTWIAGGPGALTDALARAAQDAGAAIRTSAEVAQVLVDGSAARGVRLSTGEEIHADAVASSADPKRTFLDLVDAARLGPEFIASITHYRSSGVLAKVNLALTGLPRFRGLDGVPEADRPAALAGSVHVGPTLDSLEQAFDCAKYGQVSTRPWLDLTIPSIADPELAPSGQHVMSINAQFAPRHLRDESWTDAKGQLLESVLGTLEEYAPGIHSSIVAAQIVTPEDLEREYGLSGGHIFHGEHAPDQLFLMRPVYGWATYRTPVERLYLCGAGTHPGGGISGACAVNAVREMLGDLRGRV